MFRKDLGVYFATPSHNRSESVKDFEKLVGKVSWFVGKGEKEDYEKAGATNVIESGGLSESRNAILNEAFKNNHTALMLDDDLVRYEKVVVLGKKHSTREIAFTDVVKFIKEELDKTDLKLGGTTITTNAYWYDGIPVKYRGIIAGVTMMIKPCELRFDENFKMKEDLDYSLNHIHTFGGLIKIDNIFGKFKHNMISDKLGNMKHENDGGVERDLASETKASKQIKKKWSNMVRDNPRIKTSFILKPVKRKKITEKTN